MTDPARAQTSSPMTPTGAVSDIVIQPAAPGEDVPLDLSRAGDPTGFPESGRSEDTIPLAPSVSGSESSRKRKGDKKASSDDITKKAKVALKALKLQQTALAKAAKKAARRATRHFTDSMEAGRAVLPPPAAPLANTAASHTGRSSTWPGPALEPAALASAGIYAEAPNPMSDQSIHPPVLSLDIDPGLCIPPANLRKDDHVVSVILQILAEQRAAQAASARRHSPWLRPLASLLSVMDIPP
jgi:hypothetical protein